MVSRCSSRRETQFPILPLSDSDSSFCNKLSNFYWKVRAEHLGWNTLARSLQHALFAPLSYESRSDRRISKRKTNSSGRCSSLAARESSVEIFLARPFRALSARFHFSTLSSAHVVHGVKPRTARSVTIPCLSIDGPSTRVCISRPVINKNVAFIVAHCRRAPLAALSWQNEGESSERAREAGAGGEERRCFSLCPESGSPAIRNSSKARSLLRSRARKKRTTFLAGNQVVPDDRRVACTRRRLSLFRLIYMCRSIYYHYHHIYSVLEQRDTRLIRLISTDRRSRKCFL